MISWFTHDFNDLRSCHVYSLIVVHSKIKTNV